MSRNQALDPVVTRNPAQPVATPAPLPQQRNQAVDPTCRYQNTADFQEVIPEVGN